MTDSPQQMIDQKTLYRLSGEIGGIKADIANIVKSTDAQWRKIERVSEVLEECNRKIDKLLGQDERLKDVEAGVNQYRKDKNRVYSLIAGVGVGAGGLAGTAATWLTKWMGGE